MNILPDSLFLNYTGITILLAAAQDRLNFKRGFFVACAVTCAAAMASVLGFYSANLYTAPLRFFIVPAISLLCSVAASRMFVLKRKEYAYVLYNTAVCGSLLLYCGDCRNVLESLGAGVFAGAGFALALFLLYSLRFMHSKKVSGRVSGIAAEVLFFAGIISLIISGLK